MAVPQGTSTVLSFAGPAPGSPVPDDGLFSWTVVQQDGTPAGLGAVGISDSRQRAAAALEEALRDSPQDAYGLLHKVKPSPDGCGYWYDRLLCRAYVDAASGTLVVDEPDVHGGGWGLPDVFAEIERVGRMAGAAR